MKSKINYIPYSKNIVITEYKKPEIFIPSKKVNLVSVNDITDKELKELGMISKGAMVANKSTEEQDVFEVIAIGNKVDTTEVNIGDKIILKGAAQVSGVNINGKIYGQVEEFFIAGRIID